jgi:hypothetical protein
MAVTQRAVDQNDLYAPDDFVPDIPIFDQSAFASQPLEVMQSHQFENSMIAGWESGDGLSIPKG